MENKYPRKPQKKRITTLDIYACIHIAVALSPSQNGFLEGTKNPKDDLQMLIVYKFEFKDSPIQLTNPNSSTFCQEATNIVLWEVSNILKTTKTKKIKKQYKKIKSYSYVEKLRLKRQYMDKK